MSEQAPTENRCLYRLAIAAPRGGGGKTLLSIGLARAFAKSGYCVKPFKKGPDYIDAAWLSRAAQNQATNLDPFFLSRSALQELFSQAICALTSKTDIIALLEGNRGLYDGLDERGSCSTADLARTLDCPILLILNCTKMTRTAAALIQGLVHFEPKTPFAGCILNQVGTSRQEALLRTVIEKETTLPVLGVLPRLPTNLLPERHMGLASFGDRLDIDADARIDQIAELITRYLDLPDILDHARKSEQKYDHSALTLAAPTKGVKLRAPAYHERVPTIGLVRDQAFWFYYAENLQALEAEGAQLRIISFVNHEGEASTIDWDELDALYIGGGFPEDYAAALSQSPILAALKDLAQDDFPIYAECGGFMLLARSLRSASTVYPMAGLFPVDIELCAKPQGLGYIQGTITRKTPFYPLGLELKGHEFHYSRVLGALDAAPALRLSRGQGMGKDKDGTAYDGLSFANVWASYTHIFAPALPLWAHNVIACAQRYRTHKQDKNRRKV